MLVDLIQTTTRDGVRLDGVYQTPPRPAQAGLAVDAFLLIHGTGGSFYSSSLLESLGERLLDLGCGVLRGNTRGHDLASTASTPRGGIRQGAAYEVVDECRHDLTAWSAWLRQQGCSRIGWLGHSLGAVKCLYTAAREVPPPACVVAVSPPRLSHSWLSEDVQGEPFRLAFQLARARVQAGRADELIEVQRPLPMLITAGGFVEKYGPDERYNFLRFITQVPCPVLATYGSVEVATNRAFQEVPTELRALAEQQPWLAVEVIEGADHFYLAGRDVLADRVADWLRRTGVAPSA
jgi:alpha-beta hydrolase superfamily lysophospholipase